MLDIVPSGYKNERRKKKTHTHTHKPEKYKRYEEYLTHLFTCDRAYCAQINWTKVYQKVENKIRLYDCVFCCCSSYSSVLLFFCVQSLSYICIFHFHPHWVLSCLASVNFCTTDTVYESNKYTVYIYQSRREVYIHLLCCMFASFFCFRFSDMAISRIVTPTQCGRHMHTTHHIHRQT